MDPVSESGQGEPNDQMQKAATEDDGPFIEDKVHDKKSGTGIDSPNLQGNADFEASKSKPASND
ncbi:Hypothetical predicted protein [Olea europaea subsp. europaea]|uniref:Uncharacterized protein n=1 Tax=Olea europaea subsp. europaea TaxID=158383 RepID=A0A8S0PB07_OLEEU|nr:Hypothetical predicted protein [Olea europaea subsp. europaea]